MTDYERLCGRANRALEIARQQVDQRNNIGRFQMGGAEVTMLIDLGFVAKQGRGEWWIKPFGRVSLDMAKGYSLGRKAERARSAQTIKNLRAKLARATT